MTTHTTSTLRLASTVLLTPLLFMVLPAHAQYKVVGPDGKITYTDRAPTEAQSKVVPINGGGSSSSDASLPYELRQVAQRYPVTLYSSNECAPCDAGRQFLRERGVPFADKSVSTPEDSSAMQRLTGTTSLPVVSIGSQIVKGWSQGEWASYLDAAGYPKTSQLPKTFQTGSATPLTERKESVPAPAAPAPRRATPAPAPAPAETAPPSGIRF